MITIVSPHLDDAVLSCGQLIAAMQNVHVETVFAGVPPGDDLSSYDRNSGWTSSGEAMLGRRSEDIAALGVLGCGSVVHHEWLDQQYVDDRGERNEDVRAWLVELARDPHRDLFAPLGIGHPDHITVAAAARVAAQMSGRPLYVYEELPYRVLDPAGAVDELRRLEVEWRVRVAEFPAAPDGQKVDAIRCYRSQLWNLHVNACLAPERYWKLTAR